MVLQLPHAWHFFGLELAVGTAFALSLTHAIENRKSGALFQWLTAFFYGITIELIAFNYWNNYDHGQFTVQLYHGKLPLYVTFWYPAIHYAGLKLVESWRLGRWSEPFVVGLCLMLIDAPFDTIGPDAGWWRWALKDANVEARWLGVPVTSYYWYLLFGAIYAALTRALKMRSFLVAPLVAPAIIVLGMIAFVPFHLLKAAHVPDGLIVGAHIAACAALTFTVRPARSEIASPKIKIGVALLQLYPAALCLLFYRSPAKVIAIIAAIVALMPFQRRMVGDGGAGADSDSRRLQRRSL
jgi:hypothetical protein